MRIDRCNNIEDFRHAARRRLPEPLFHFLDGGADDEASLARNTDSFAEARLIPNGLADLTGLDMSTEVLGRRVKMPVMIAPTGVNRVFHTDGELAVARAAEAAGIYYALSTLSTFSIEDVAAATTGPTCFQIYIHKDRSMTQEFVARCKAAKYDSLCLTIDTLVAGNRERDLVHGMSLPPKLTPRTILNFALRPAWVWDLLTGPRFELSNVKDRVAKGTGEAISVIDYVNSQFDRTITWADARPVIEEWGGPFAIKGVLSVEDARRAVDVGASAIMVSNHGGRQMDGAAAPFDMLGPIVDAVGDQIEVILDGGVRRGTHVLKALAMGARACSIGRGYLYALAAGGEPGVARMLGRMRDEIERDMILMGVRSPDELTRDMLQRGGPLDYLTGGNARAMGVG